MVGALLLYMAFLMLVDPLIRKPDAYTEQLHNEEENEVTMALGCQHTGPWAKGSPKVEVPLLPAPVILRLLLPVHFPVRHQDTGGGAELPRHLAGSVCGVARRGRRVGGGG